MTEDAFVSTILQNPRNAAILGRLPAMRLNDAWLVSGALFQTVWNVVTGREPGHGIKDYDIFYFDPDTSWDAENDVISRAKRIFVDVDAVIEIRNQARVHLWYEKKFGAPYPPLLRATDAIDRFLSHNAQVGIRPTGNGYEIYAPRGFDDIAHLIVRPNRAANFGAKRYLEKAERWKILWPELTIIPA